MIIGYEERRSGTSSTKVRKLCHDGDVAHASRSVRNARNALEHKSGQSYRLRILSHGDVGCERHVVTAGLLMIICFYDDIYNYYYGESHTRAAAYTLCM